MPSKPAVAPTLAAVRARLKGEANPEDAKFLQGFFKTGPGQYGEGDAFLGIRVPVTRRIVRDFRDLALPDVETLLHDQWHEARLVALLILVEKFKRGSPSDRDAIAGMYLRNTKYINNWDLVDSSARAIVGAYLLFRSRQLLDRLAGSESLWERRIAIVATHEFIMNNDHDDTVRIARALMRDKHDLIHKAVGWMLREVGKKDEATLNRFLADHAHEMPRTTLRYAIERKSPGERTRWMGEKARSISTAIENQST